MLSRPIPDELIRRLGKAPLVRIPRRRGGSGQRPMMLTPALYESLKLLAGGRTDPQIAAATGVSVSAAKDRSKRLLAYFDVENRTALAALAYRERIV